ncbi:MAG: PHP domain-containing protein, partial [Nitrospirae bacterium]|nr:PHP domain-containing protein [Nitrospirota bacterium]
MSRIDLHLHTTHSDGSLSPTEVLRLAHKTSVTALAITDHDIVSGIPEAIAAGAELGIEIIPGVEISSRLGNSELHILGYCLHWQDPELNQRLATLRESRHSRNPQIIERLRALGLDVTYEEVRALA